MTSALFRRRSRITRNRARFYRPLVESLESRDLLAFNLTISTDPTANVSSATVHGTTTFSATANNANLDVADIDTALGAGDVVVTSGDGGLQAGNISTGFTTHSFGTHEAATL